LCSRYVARTPPVEARSPSRRSNVENAPHRRPVTGQPATPTSHIRCAILRTPPSHASHRPTAHADPAERSHYVVISWDGCKLVTRVHIILPQQRNPCTDCKSAQLEGSLYHAPKLHPGPCSSVGVRPRTDRHTHTHRQSRVTTMHFASSTTYAKCKKSHK